MLQVVGDLSSAEITFRFLGSCRHPQVVGVLQLSRKILQVCGGASYVTQQERLSGCAGGSSTEVLRM